MRQYCKQRIIMKKKNVARVPTWLGYFMMKWFKDTFQNSFLVFLFKKLSKWGFYWRIFVFLISIRILIPLSLHETITDF